MQTIRARNVNDAYPKTLELIAGMHVIQDSRNGRVMRVPEPVAIRYAHPHERVLFDATRDANPFFHLFEALWMLTGANDLATMTYFVPRFAEYSDDGVSLHGAYGHRWRRHFRTDDGFGRTVPGFDQLEGIVNQLGAHHDDRRAVLQMWDPPADLGRHGKDVPCNLTATFQVIHIDGFGPSLCMTVFNRSNDAIWGALGANAVHFSVLQEYLATRLGVDIGWYEQVSANLHVYVDKWPQSVGNTDPYQRPSTGVYTERMVLDPSAFDAECAELVKRVTVPGLSNESDFPCRNPFLEYVAWPMLLAYRVYRSGDPDVAVTDLAECIEDHGRVDWLVAGIEWMKRRANRRKGA